VCNAAESLVVHARVAPAFLPVVAQALAAAGVELVGDAEARRLVAAMGEATEEDFATSSWRSRCPSRRPQPRGGGGPREPLQQRPHGGDPHHRPHRRPPFRRRRRLRDRGGQRLHRFTDGEEFGFRAEIGISTQKLHARPMALRELTTYKYVVWGDGQTRT